MENSDIELKLIEDYREKVNMLIDKLIDSGDSERGQLTVELVKRMQLYEKQLEKVKDTLEEIDRYSWYFSQLYYFRSRHALLGEDLIHSSTKRAMNQSQGLGEVLLLGGAATLQYKQRARRAIEFLTKALEQFDGINYRFYRAHLYSRIDEHTAAIEDVEYLLKNLDSDNPNFIEARKRKDEYEAAQDNKKDSGCLPNIFGLFMLLSVTGVLFLRKL